MPKIKISCIVSFSSEDANYPASNLLSNDIVSNNRWLGQKGETSNSIVFQLEKSTQITSVSIGTHHSALIEVLVGRSEASSQQFEVLICASSFMNPADSRNSENISRVRSFSKDQMVPAVQTKNWDRVRVVCTQPFNKHVQFGLSFIELFSSESLPQSVPSCIPKTDSQTSMLGRFKVRDVSSDEDEAKPGDLFARFKKGSLSTDAQIRKASSPRNLNSNVKDSSQLLVKTSRPQKVAKIMDSISSDHEDSTLSRGRDALFYDEKEDGKSDRIDRIIKRDREEKAKEFENKTPIVEKKAGVSRKEDLDTLKKDLIKTKKKNPYYDDEETEKDVGKKEKTPLKVSKDNPEESISSKVDNAKTQNDKKQIETRHRDGRKRDRSTDKNEANSSKKTRSDEKSEDGTSDLVEIPRGPRCLDGVVFVLSGFVNPKRGTLRDMAISLGARYSPDWGPNCTHLVCAFPNTPKIDQVKKSRVLAAIVTGKWIEDCKTEEAFLPWKWYAMDSKQRISRPKGAPFKPRDKESETRRESRRDSRSNDRKNPQTSTVFTVSDPEGDTDDEIERVMQKQEQKEANETGKPSSKAAKVTQKDSNLFSDSESTTDVDEETQSKFVERSKDSENGKGYKKATESTKNKTEVSFDSDTTTDIDEEIIAKFTKKKMENNLEEATQKQHYKNEYDKTKELIKTGKTLKKDANLFNSAYHSESSTDIEEESLRKIKNRKGVKIESSLDDDPDHTILGDEALKQKDDSEMSFVSELPDFFSGIKFFVDPNLKKDNYNISEIKRYVLAYKGEILDAWPNKLIDVAVTTEKWADSLRQGKAKKCSFMPPEWVWKCNDSRELYAFNDFLIV